MWSQPHQYRGDLARDDVLGQKSYNCGGSSMTVRSRVFGAFKESFDLDDDVDTSKLVYQEYPAWTSIGHMILVAALESEFDTMLETDDILEMSSFDKSVSIMSKYANKA
jgi:acyl carrier protein